MFDQIFYEVALEFQTNDFTIFLYKKSLYWISAFTGLQVTSNVNKFKDRFMVSRFIQTEIRNVDPKKLL